MLGDETAHRGEQVLLQIVNDLRHSVRLLPVFYERVHLTSASYPFSGALSTKC